MYLRHILHIRYYTPFLTNFKWKLLHLNKQIKQLKFIEKIFSQEIQHKNFVRKNFDDFSNFKVFRIFKITINNQKHGIIASNFTIMEKFSLKTRKIYY